AGGGTWSEFGDVQSFPDGQPQVTRGSGALTLIDGSTFPTSDSRNAYCIKITDPANFRATTDNNIDNTASTDFDTRLFLFDKKGKPLLFNDDTHPSTAPFASTLTGVATDGSGYVLTQPGEYILVIAGFPDDPLDNIANNLFNQGAGLVHAPIPNSNNFSVWENNNPATGGYFVALQGVSYCQDKLDIVGTGFSLDNDTQLCSGDGNGGFGNCNNDSIISEKSSITTGYLDDDVHLDVIFDTFINDVPSICLGDGKGGYKSCSVLILGTDRTNHSTLGDINNDGMTDAVFVSTFNANHYACLGNGAGNFTVCNTFPNTDEQFSGDVDLAFMNGDQFLDVVISHSSNIEICAGNGTGGFGTCSVTTVNSGKIAIADFNGDNILDIVTASDGNSNNICLNDGTGTLTCSSINAETNRTRDLAVGDLENDGDMDIIFTNLSGVNSGINKVCQNIGAAIFSCSNVSGIADNYFDVELNLINDDNILDVIFTGRPENSSELFTRVCIGNGDGTFSNCINDTNLKFGEIELGEFGQSSSDVIFASGFE
ncbi:hypothetical protein MNBD_GAMMA01-1847, partial [hydrothermal vent metagenome]